MGRAPFNERQARGEGMVGALGSGSRASDRSGKRIWEGTGPNLHRSQKSDEGGDNHGRMWSLLNINKANSKNLSSRFLRMFFLQKHALRLERPGILALGRANRCKQKVVFVLKSVSSESLFCHQRFGTKTYCFLHVSHVT